MSCNFRPGFEQLPCASRVLPGANQQKIAVLFSNAGPKSKEKQGFSPSFPFPTGVCRDRYRYRYRYRYSVRNRYMDRDRHRERDRLSLYREKEPGLNPAPICSAGNLPAFLRTHPSVAPAICRPFPRTHPSVAPAICRPFPACTAPFGARRIDHFALCIMHSQFSPPFPPQRSEYTAFSPGPTIEARQPCPPGRDPRSRRSRARCSAGKWHSPGRGPRRGAG